MAALGMYVCLCVFVDRYVCVSICICGSKFKMTILLYVCMCIYAFPKYERVRWQLCEMATLCMFVYTHTHTHTHTHIYFSVCMSVFYAFYAFYAWWCKMSTL